MAFGRQAKDNGPTVVVAGAGFAGMVAAAIAAHGGAKVVLLERGRHAGGTSRLASGWIWRYRTPDLWAWGAPHGDRALQAVVHENLPDALTWLRRSTGRFASTSTGRSQTDGVRINVDRVLDRLLRLLPGGSLKIETTLVDVKRRDSGKLRCAVDRRGGGTDVIEADALICAGGGYAARTTRIAAECSGRGAADSWLPRNAGLSDGTTMDIAMDLGGVRVPVNGECLARLVPAGITLEPSRMAIMSMQLAEHAVLVDARGTPVEWESNDWSQSKLAWRIARTTGTGWFLIDRSVLENETTFGTVRRCLQRAKEAGGRVIESRAGELPGVLEHAGLRLGRAAIDRAGTATRALEVAPGITHTWCGLRVNDRMAVVNEDGVPIPRLFAAGTDVGGLGNGGYASGLALGLVSGVGAGMSAVAAARA